MATPHHTQVHLRGYSFNDSRITWNLAAAVEKTHIGRGLSIDTSAANTMKLAADGDTIAGRLMTFEDRIAEGTKVGGVEMRFSNTLPIKSGETVNVGDTVVGAGSGEVKAAATANHSVNIVAEVTATHATVVKI